MRVLFINYEYPPLGGGTGNAASYLMREFEKIPDLYVDLVTSSDAGDEQRSLGDKTRLFRLNVGKKRLQHWRRSEVIRFLLRARLLCRKLARSERYDLSHAFFTIPGGDIAYGLRRRMPYIVSLRGSDVPGFNPRFGLEGRILTPALRRIWGHASAVVANSDDLAELARKTEPDLQATIITNGIDTSEFSPPEKPQPLERGLKLLCVSRLLPRKGLSYMINALPQIQAFFPYVHLTVVGQGPGESQLQREVKLHSLQNAVTFSGRIRHDLLPDVYRKSHLFVLPSLNEGMSNALLEAMASGLPCVVTDTGGAAHLLAGGVVLVPKRDPDALAEAIIKLATDPQRCRDVGSAARHRAEALTWTRIAEHYVELYEKAASSRDA